MSARDDYPLLNAATATVAFDREAQSALDEIDLLRASIDLAELRRLRRENTELKVRLMRGVIRRTRS